jgi:hypothetical protein
MEELRKDDDSDNVRETPTDGYLPQPWTLLALKYQRMTQSSTLKLPWNHPAGFGFKPSEWGPCFWKVAHNITFLYPSSDPTEQQKRLVQAFFNLLPMLLPCGICGAHLVKHMQEHPLDDEVLANRYNLSKWFVDIHNEANKVLGKPEIKYDDAYRYFLVDSSRDPHGRVSDKEQAAWSYGWVIGVLLVLAIIFFVLWVTTLRKLEKCGGTGR